MYFCWVSTQEWDGGSWVCIYPGTVLSISQILMHLIPTTTLWGRCYHCPNSQRRKWKHREVCVLEAVGYIASLWRAGTTPVQCGWVPSAYNNALHMYISYLEQFGSQPSCSRKKCHLLLSTWQPFHADIHMINPVSLRQQTKETMSEYESVYR